MEITDIQVEEQHHAARTQVATVPIMVAQPNEIMYEVDIGADEPDEGLHTKPMPPPITNITGCVAGRYSTQSAGVCLGTYHIIDTYSSYTPAGC